MAPRHFLILLAVVSSLTDASVGSGVSGTYTGLPYTGFDSNDPNIYRSNDPNIYRSNDPNYIYRSNDPNIAVGRVIFTPSALYCSTTGNYSKNTPYQVNLFNLLNNLSSGAITNRGFTNSVAGEVPDVVFGLTMCYADRNWTECRNCLHEAASGVTLICPFSREMKACDDACVIRYSNESFFSVADLTVAFDNSSNSFVTDIASMNTTRSSLMSRLVGQAAVSELRLANGSNPYTDLHGRSQVMYGLAQCTRDLNASECTRCLEYFVERLSDLYPTNTYGAVKGYSCYVVYKIGDELVITIPPATAASGWDLELSN
ncbi:hypothetical protein BAE44_0022723 [Dichanthelium oligosanthes]|uniref:Gnk2-homologous domain-containing protein n=1 Tax=Dichanthelium oligosanthes TaxID=888268 RepID=A0A1E5UTS1_9POAL|nr:hypothetical protein BAE44_0022723 [Dichanthelium oligosanthes]